jgi:TRAP-type C4-dicarboxylate transport system substrate-binding protein
MKRRQFMKRAATATAATAVAASSFPAPAISQGLMKWRMQTTWPKNFPGLGTGANKLAEFIGAASGGKLTVEVFGGGEIVPAFETMDAVSSGHHRIHVLQGRLQVDLIPGRKLRCGCGKNSLPNRIHRSIPRLVNLDGRWPAL